MSTARLHHYHLDEISIEDRIGRGTFSVYKAKIGEKVIAVKRMDCDKNEIPREVEVHSTLPSHPNILPLVGYAHSKDGFSIYICLELADKSLYQYLHKEKKKPSVEKSAKWAMQIADGMHHLHKHELAHRDLKSANILLFEKEDITKVCDFGSTRQLERTASATGMTGTYRWMAPELNETGATKINQRCDVFSFGMILYELFAHKIPFWEIREGVDAAASVRKGKRPCIPPEFPQDINTLMQSCWKQLPNDRPTFENLLKVQWQTSVYTDMHWVKNV